MNSGCLVSKMESQVKSCFKLTTGSLLSPIFQCSFSFHCLFSGQFPSTFVEPVTIPSTKTGENLYVCINDFNSVESGSLPLKRGKNIKCLIACHICSVFQSKNLCINWSLIRSFLWNKNMLNWHTNAFCLINYCPSYLWANNFVMFVMLSLHDFFRESGVKKMQIILSVFSPHFHCDLLRFCVILTLVDTKPGESAKLQYRPFWPN